MVFKQLRNPYTKRMESPIFVGTDDLILKWVESNLDKLNIVYTHNISIYLKRKQIFINADGTCHLFRIKEVSLINLK